MPSKTQIIEFSVSERYQCQHRRLYGLRPTGALDVIVIGLQFWWDLVWGIACDAGSQLISAEMPSTQSSIPSRSRTVSPARGPC